MAKRALRIMRGNDPTIGPSGEGNSGGDAMRVRWVESERNPNPEFFRFGQIVERRSLEAEVVATCDRNGWR